MSKQKQQSNNIRIHQVINFETLNQMQQYADAQSIKLQASEKELTQVKGISQGGQNALYSLQLQRKLIENKTQKKPNVQAPRRFKMNNAQFFIEQFKIMNLQKFQIVFKDKVSESQSPPQSRAVPSLEYPQQNIVQQLLANNKIGTSIKRKEAKKLPSPLQLIQQKDQSKLELLLYQKNCEMEQLQKQIEIESLNHKEQEDMLQIKNTITIQYYPSFELQISQKMENIEKIEQGGQNFNKQTNNETIQRRIQILQKRIEIKDYEIIKIDQNTEEELKSLNNYLNSINQQLKMKIHENQQFQSTQSYDQSRKVISRRHNFEQHKSSQINAQLENQIQALKQEKQRLQQEINEKLNQIQEQKNKLRMDQEKSRSQIRKYEEDILNNYFKEDNLKKEKNELSNLQIQYQALKEESSNIEKQIQQNKEDYNNKYFKLKNQIISIQNQKNEITEQMKNPENQKSQLPKIDQKQFQTESQMAVVLNTQNINELIESYKNNYLGQNLITQDEIQNQEQQSILTLKLLKISYSPQKIQQPYKTKWIALDSLETSDFLQEYSYGYIEQSQQEFQYITSDQINAFAELLQIKEQVFYFRLPKKIRQIYPRLFIFPSCFLEEIMIFVQI
ncbi:unnamed protein product (macronuclear) [Paramecium tetraurelia]|uniref:Uncharacterized protein n=1 Tax=Paramecium tetraurelia TaxID=5888 RepID=A0C616_PARTE|nr:uncharacterized protein GSPATT00035362001 [Paramecium tetraurelia]CAK66233.1 unnamed protein product [Paramecium tetraurelia]|eukprot:XP_001433630.1 hypothetical protein (macronuclear) [Paramecium tetraurelia strain d4-2]